ncbi:unnamed protein product [Vitrella brassicaformis CCMP3155]|uniref:Uncharacterized protein n=1 Tax=Vitrella brassicaformis (strain CCMP3155) TaxID=1169540 RepID=A0A0G4E9Y1_VITBC|nr:unnamed protein product [Vitrella brassicaformis CCMP3155]|eukprot:CEL92015.1 unnamed protein product [Vitrella brassicaformis CCMP3155]
MASEGFEHRMTKRQAAIAAAEAAAGVGRKRKPSMDVDVSSGGGEEDGSEWEERGRRTTKAAKKGQRVDKKDKADKAAAEAKPKKKGGRSKAQATEEGHQMEVKSPLEELPEVLWMGGGAGLGALVGFVSCMESLSSVNGHFRSLTQQPGMHPILDLDASPTMDIAEKWIGRRLSECVSISVYHRPTPSLVYLLESLSAKVESVDLQCPYEPPTDKKGNDLPFERDTRNRKGNLSRISLPHKNGPIVFERLESASIRSVWVKIAEDREYQLPVLKDLGLVNLDTRGPRQWIRDSGIKSLHLISDEEDIGRSHEVRLDQVANFLKDTPSAQSLTSLTGRVSFQQQSQSLYYGKVPDDAFIDHIATDIGPLDEIEMGLAEVQTSQYIQKLHRFRSKLLSADSASETYFHLPLARRHAPCRYNRLRDANKTSTDLHLHLPFTGDGEALADCLATVELCCRKADKVTLDACRRSDHVKKIPGLDSLVCEAATELTTMAGGGKKTLPSYITSNPAAVFPRVSSVVVSHKEEEGWGEDFYECGAGDVLHALSPFLSKVCFEFPDLYDKPRATCTLVPDGLGFMSSEGKEVEVQVKLDVDCCSYVKFSCSEAGREFMESGRVSCIDVHIAGQAHVNETREMHGTFVECVVKAFSNFPALKCVVLRVDKPPLFGPAFDLAGELRKAGKKRVRVTERTDGTVVLRPSQTRRKVKRETENAVKREKDVVVKQEEEE